MLRWVEHSQQGGVGVLGGALPGEPGERGVVERRAEPCSPGGLAQRASPGGQVHPDLGRCPSPTFDDSRDPDCRGASRHPDPSSKATLCQSSSVALKAVFMCGRILHSGFQAPVSRASRVKFSAFCCVPSPLHCALDHQSDIKAPHPISPYTHCAKE